MEWTLKSFDDLTTYELYSFIRLRNEVFVVEQDCIYLDTDGDDLKAFHLFANVEDKCIAYCRMFLKNDKYEGASSIGRVVVNKESRRSDLGSELMRKAISFLKSAKDQSPIIISAQSHLQGFYENLGFDATNKRYLEDGIPHLEMHLSYN